LRKNEEFKLNIRTDFSAISHPQVPYFELVGSLEKKNSDIFKEKEDLKVLLDQRQVDLDTANAHIEVSSNQSNDGSMNFC
jgi:hypothetical protein